MSGYGADTPLLRAILEEMQKHTELLSSIDKRLDDITGEHEWTLGGAEGRLHAVNTYRIGDRDKDLAK